MAVSGPTGPTGGNGPTGPTGRHGPLPPTFPDLVSLDLFASTVRLGSISAAATSHGMSQPSVSARIRDLERRLGMELLARSAAGSQPTANGAVVAEWTEALLASAAELASAVDALRGREQASLRIAASYTIAEFLLPGWVTRWRAHHGDRAVELSVLNSASVLDSVSARSTEIGFVESPGPLTGLRSRQVGGDELVVVVAPDHPWARRRTPLTAVMLVRTPFVVREKGSGTREAFASALTATGLSEPPALAELGSTAAVRESAAAGLGPAVLSELAVRSELASGRLVTVAVDGVDLTRRFHAVWSGPAKPPAAVRELVAVAVKGDPKTG